MLIMNWTKDDTGRISATWIKDAEYIYRPLSLLSTKAEPAVAPSHSYVRSDALTNLRTWLCTALHLPQSLHLPQ